MDPAQARKFDWRPKEGLLIVSGADGENPLALPIAGIPSLAVQARRFMAGAQAQQARKNAQGDWMLAQTATVQSAEVASMQTQKGDVCVLIFDPRTEAELPLSLSIELARQVGEALIEAAAAASKSPPSRN